MRYSDFWNEELILNTKTSTKIKACRNNTSL